MGALHALCGQIKRQAISEVTASSTGNHGAAVAYSAKWLGIKATIFLPYAANPTKKARIRELGARIVDVGSDLVEAASAAAEYSRRDGVFYLDDATDTAVPEGTGTIGLELLQQCPRASTVIVPMGDTALIRGVAAAVKAMAPPIKVIGVQAENAPSYYLSWKEGKAIPTSSCNTIADGLATRTPQISSVSAIRKLVDDVVLVSEGELLEAVGYLMLVEHLVAEPAGAAAVAAALKMNPFDSETVLLVTGANLDPKLLEHIAFPLPRHVYH